MAIRTSTLRPGLLVSLKSTISGNVKYSSATIEAEHVTEEGAKRARWETERVVTDPKEHERATEARGKARHAIARHCAATAFGLLCPEDKAAELEAGIAEAREIAETFNGDAKYSRVGVYAICGRIAADDAEAIRAVNNEVQELLRAMESGVERLDTAAIREAANKARSLGMMLSPAAAARVTDAIEAARTAARRIVKAGEGAAQEIDRIALRRIANARTEFLDLDEGSDIAAPTVTGRAVDLEPEEPSEETQGREIKARGEIDFGDDDSPPTVQAAPAAPMFALEF